MANRDVVIEKSKGQLIPTNYLEKLFKDGQPTAWGCALVNDGKVQYMHMTEDQYMPSATILKAIDQFQDDAMVLHFGFQPKPVTDPQPYVIIGDEKQPDLACFLTGDFSNFAKQGSSHPPEFHAAIEGLRPKLNTLYRLVGNDMEKLFNGLSDPVLQQEIGNFWVKEGNIILIAGIGKIWKYSSNPNVGRYDWGWTTNNLGYVDKPPADAGTPVEAVDKLAGMKKKVFKKEETKPAPAEDKHAMREVMESGTAEIKPAKKGKVIKADPKMSNGEKKKFYNRRAGFCPANFRDCPAVISTVEFEEPTVLKDLKDLGPALEATGKTPVATTVPTVPAKGDQPDVPPTDAPVTSPPTSPTYPVIPPKELEHGKNFLKSWAGKMEILNPDTIQDLEEKFPSAAQQLGLSGTSVLRQWSLAQFEALAKDSNLTKTTATLLFNLRNTIIQLNPQWGMVKEEKPDGVHETTATKKVFKKAS